MTNEDKQKFLDALRLNKGELEEHDLGAALGFTEAQTNEIIDELLKEHKIEFQSFGLCSYVVIEKK